MKVILVVDRCGRTHYMSTQAPLVTFFKEPGDKLLHFIRERPMPEDEILGDGGCKRWGYPKTRIRAALRNLLEQGVIEYHAGMYYIVPVNPKTGKAEPLWPFEKPPLSI